MSGTTITVPRISVRSRFWIELTKCVPRPGMENTFSTTNDPVSVAAAAGPRYESTGRNALRRQCFQTTSDLLNPFARAVRT